MKSFKILESKKTSAIQASIFPNSLLPEEMKQIDGGIKFCPNGVTIHCNFDIVLCAIKSVSCDPFSIGCDPVFGNTTIEQSTQNRF